MAAEVAAAAGAAAVTVYDRMPSPARKLLYAGRGGLNLTHSEPFPAFAARYGAAAARLRPALDRFGPCDMRRWCDGLGIETFVGSSGRVFPASFKTSPLLRAWLRRLGGAGVRFAMRHRWLGWDGAGSLRFHTPDGEVAAEADAVVLALGGASWPWLGSDGAWVDLLGGTGAGVAGLAPANCGFTVDWSESFRERFEGAALKNVALTFAGERTRGDATVTRAGLEGGAVYPLAAALREALGREGSATLQLALRPDLPEGALAARLGKGSRKQSRSTLLRKALHLAPVATALLHEGFGAALPAAGDHQGLARAVNAVPLRVTGTAPIARAISSAGGVTWAAVDADYMLKGRPGVFLAGEMLDWEAPTGGYLLQACFATGAAAGHGASGWLRRAR